MPQDTFAKSRLNKAMAMFVSVPLCAMPLATQAQTRVRARTTITTVRTNIRDNSSIDLREGLKTQIRDNIGIGIRQPIKN